MHEDRSTGPAGLAAGARTAKTNSRTVEAARVELDALGVRLRRLAEAGVVTGGHRATLQTIAGQLRDIRQRLGADAPGCDAAIDALGDVAERVDGLADTHRDCVYGPELAQLSERFTAAVKLLIA
jgi:hypothetical protein